MSTRHLDPSDDGRIVSESIDGVMETLEPLLVELLAVLKRIADAVAPETSE